MLTHLLLVFFKVFFLTFLHLYNKGISRVVILFLILFNFQDAVSVALASSFNIISHSKPFVKYFFQVFSKSFFVISSALFRGNLIIISLFLSFVKPFLKSFFSSSLSSSRNGLRLLFLFFFSLQSKSNILLTLSRGPPRSTVMLLYTFSSPLSSKDVFHTSPFFWSLCTKTEHLSLFSPKLPRFFLYI